jgi:hypothetical protein
LTRSICHRIAIISSFILQPTQKTFDPGFSPVNDQVELPPKGGSEPKKGVVGG